MGMAASQARYLALVARKSNCEYEGQQINQSRMALSNQSANLFNQMLGLKVPVPPSTQDYTTTQYSYKDGLNASTISSWQQLSKADPDYNYVVTHYYYADVYTGSQKKLSDPQVQFPENMASSAEIAQATLKVQQTYEAYQEALKTKEGFDTLSNNLAKLEAQAAKLSSYSSSETGIKACMYDSANNTYTLKYADGTTADKVFNNYASLTGAQQADVDALMTRLQDIGALQADYDYQNDAYFSFNDDGTFTFAQKSDLGEVSLACSLAGENANQSLNKYDSQTVSEKIDTYTNDIANLKNSIESINPDGVDLRKACEEAQKAYEEALEEYGELKQPAYIGNCELTALPQLDKDQKAEIDQVVADMKEQGIDAAINRCFDENGNYLGGIYSFKLNGVTYYTTYEELSASYDSGTGINNIDGQAKLPYYNATYVSKKIEETEKALLETDGNGRFTSVRFENDTVTYALEMETVTDEAAYKDAMNQYYYDNAVYDKTVQDINAKTSLIQQEDMQLELRLKQLDTEQNALKTEMDAVKKVVDDNVESSFKTFGG